MLGAVVAADLDKALAQTRHRAVQGRRRHAHQRLCRDPDALSVRLALAAGRVVVGLYENVAPRTSNSSATRRSTALGRVAVTATSWTGNSGVPCACVSPALTSRVSTPRER